MSMQGAAVRQLGFGVSRVRFRGIDALRLADRAGTTEAVFALKGATLLDWRVLTADGELLELIDGYQCAAELNGQHGVRNGLLAPFQNRIADARYRFDGVDHDLLPGAEGDARLIYHGLARTLDFLPLRIEEGPEGASVLFGCEAIRPGAFAGYPFAISLRLTVNLSASGLSLFLSAANVGSQDAPVTLGWHPYFRLGDAGIDALELKVPAARLILTDDALIPLAGDAARAPLGEHPEQDFSIARPIGKAVLDCCYADHAPSADKLVRSTLRDPSTGNALRIWQDGGLVHVFTGDTLARDARRSIAIEPVDAPTDAFNRSDCNESIRLPAGGRRTFSFGAEFVAATPNNA